MPAPRPASGSHEPSHQVTTRVYACVPEFELVYVRTADSLQYVLTKDIAGVHLDELREGQVVECLVSMRLPRVLSAKLTP